MGDPCNNIAMFTADKDGLDTSFYGVDTGIALTFGTVNSGGAIPLGAATKWRLASAFPGLTTLQFVVNDATLLQSAFIQLTVTELASIQTFLASAATFTTGGGSATWTWTGFTGSVFTPGNVCAVDVELCDQTAEFNCACETTAPSFSTLGVLRTRMAIQAGYAAQAANLPAGVTAEINEYLFTAQKQLYLKYRELRTERFFRWTMVPGQRYYSLTTEEGSCIKVIEPKRVTWVGFEDLNAAWYQLVGGINPLFYTRAQVTTGWPTHYDIRSCIEIFPAPQAAYTLWVKAHFTLEPFAADGDITTIDDELVLLYAVANFKSAKGKPDATRAMNQATARLKDLVSATHLTKRYVPATSVQQPATPPRFLPLNGGPA